jgi:hypothetical protein
VDSERQFLSVKKIRGRIPANYFCSFPSPPLRQWTVLGLQPGIFFHFFSLSCPPHSIPGAVYILYIFILAHILSPFGFHSFVSSFFPAKAHSLILPKPAFHLIAFCIFPIWISFYSLPFSVHMSLCWFSTQFSILLLTFYRFFICRYLPFGQFFFLLVFSLHLCLSTSSILSVLSGSVRQDEQVALSLLHHMKQTNVRPRLHCKFIGLA